MNLFIRNKFYPTRKKPIINVGNSPLNKFYFFYTSISIATSTLHLYIHVLPNASILRDQECHAKKSAHLSEWAKKYNFQLAGLWYTSKSWLSRSAPSPDFSDHSYSCFYEACWPFHPVKGQFLSEPPYTTEWREEVSWGTHFTVSQ